MYNIKNSMKNIARNKSKYIIMAVLVFIISFVSIISLIINTSTNDVIEDYYNEYGTTATIEFDPTKMMQSMGTSSSAESLTYDQLSSYADSDYVENVIYTQTVTFTSDDVDFSDANAPQITSNNSDGENSPMARAQQLSLVGSDDITQIDDFSTDTYKLLSGEMPGLNEVLMDQEIAENNDLNIGDTVTVVINEKNITLTISGLYGSTETNRSPFKGKTLYTTYQTVSNLDDSKTMIDATYQLKSYKDVEAFEDELYSKGLSEAMYVNNNKQVLNNLTSPLESLQKVSTIFLILVIFFGGAIIIFITFLMIKERKYEIGVLRAIGSSRKRVISMLFVEMIVVVLTVSVISGTVGILSSSSIFSFVSENMVSTTTTSNHGPGGNFGGGPGGQMSTEEQSEVLSKLDVKLDIVVLIEFILLWLILVGLATLSSAYLINKHSPNEILRRRD